MSTSDTILACLQMNVENARTKGLREFAEKQLADYKTSLERRARPKPTAPRAFSSFLDKLEHPVSGQTADAT